MIPVWPRQRAGTEGEEMKTKPSAPAARALQQPAGQLHIGALEDGVGTPGTGQGGRVEDHVGVAADHRRIHRQQVARQRLGAHGAQPRQRGLRPAGGPDRVAVLAQGRDQGQAQSAGRPLRPGAAAHARRTMAAALILAAVPSSRTVRPGCRRPWAWASTSTLGREAAIWLPWTKMSTTRLGVATHQPADVLYPGAAGPVADDDVHGLAASGRPRRRTLVDQAGQGGAAALEDAEGVHVELRPRSGPQRP